MRPCSTNSRVRSSLIGGNRQDLRLPTLASDLRRERVGVRVAYLEKLGLGRDLEDLVSRRKNGYTGPLIYANFTLADRAQQSDFRVPQRGAGFENDVPRLHLGTLEDQVLAARHAAFENDVAALLPGVFLHHNRVGALGARRARHDVDRLAGLDAKRRRLASPRFPEQLQPRRWVGHVARQHRVAVPSRPVEGRIVAIGLDRFSQNPSGGIIEGNDIRRSSGRQTVHLLGDERPGLFTAQQRHSVNIPARECAVYRAPVASSDSSFEPGTKIVSSRSGPVEIAPTSTPVWSER